METQSKDKFMRNSTLKTINWEKYPSTYIYVNPLVSLYHKWPIQPLATLGCMCTLHSNLESL